MVSKESGILVCVSSMISESVLAKIPITTGQTDINIPDGTRWIFAVGPTFETPEWMSEIAAYDSVSKFANFNIAFEGIGFQNQAWAYFLAKNPELGQCVCSRSADPTSCLAGNWPR